MNKALNPAHIAPPYKDRYSHAIEVSADSRMVFVSGTVGVKPDGTVPAEFAAQVAGLADPRWMVEVDLVAAKG